MIQGDSGDNIPTCVKCKDGKMNPEGRGIGKDGAATVYKLYKEKILPIIGMGGVFNWKDAIEFMVAGASAVGIGTVNFIDYNAGKSIIDGIINYMGSKNIENISEIIGSVKDG